MISRIPKLCKSLKKTENNSKDQEEIIEIREGRKKGRGEGWDWIEEKRKRTYLLAVRRERDKRIKKFPLVDAKITLNQLYFITIQPPYNVAYWPLNRWSKS